VPLPLWPILTHPQTLRLVAGTVLGRVGADALASGAKILGDRVVGGMKILAGVDEPPRPAVREVPVLAPPRDVGAHHDHDHAAGKQPCCAACAQGKACTGGACSAPRDVGTTKRDVAWLRLATSAALGNQQAAQMKAAKADLALRKKIKAEAAALDKAEAEKNAAKVGQLRARLAALQAQLSQLQRAAANPATPPARVAAQADAAIAATSSEALLTRLVEAISALAPDRRAEAQQAPWLPVESQVPGLPGGVAVVGPAGDPYAYVPTGHDYPWAQPQPYGAAPEPEAEADPLEALEALDGFDELAVAGVAGADEPDAFDGLVPAALTPDAFVGFVGLAGFDDDGGGGAGDDFDGAGLGGSAAEDCTSCLIS